jgi:hypothetical protein
LSRRKRLAALALAALIAAGGCAGPPRPGEPISRDRLESIVAQAMSRRAAGPLRASGSGRVAQAGGSIEFSFALLYDPPGWLRADARPPLAAAPGAPGVSALVVGDRLTARLAAADRWLAADLRDVLPGIQWTDPGSFVVGRPDLRFLTRLRHPRLERAGGEFVVSGDLFGRAIEAAIDTTALSVTRIAVSDGDALSVTVAYGGHGWNRDAGMPRTVAFTYTDGPSSATLTLTYDRAASESFVDRPKETIEPPRGAPVLRWEDLGTRRRP